MTRFRVVKILLVAIAIVASAGLLGVLSLRIYGAHRLANASSRYEREVGPLSLRTFVRPSVAVEANAVTWQRPGVLAAVFFPGDQALVGSLSAKRFADWTPDETAKLEAILERNEPAIELLLRSRGMKASTWEIPYEEGTTAKIPNLLAALNVARTLNARGRLALGRRDLETALASAETLGALARSHEAESATIVLLIGVAIEKLQIGLVHELATAATTTSAVLDRLDASMCDEDLTRAVRQTLRGGAAAIAHDVGSEALLNEVHRTIHGVLARGIADLVVAATIEAHRTAEKSLGRPIQSPLGDSHAGDRDGGAWKQLLLTYGPNAASISARATATTSARELARLAIALRREALATGHYPAAPPALAGVPADDPLTGGPRVYEVHADGSAELRSTTTVEIVQSITPGGQLFFKSLYQWALPAAPGGAPANHGG